MTRYFTRVNDVEFDHVFTVLSGGTVTDGPSGIYAPDSHDGELSGEGWEYWSHGRSGQYGYRGPIMHASEFIGGGMERDLLSEPGIYAVVADYTDGELSADDIPADHPVRPVESGGWVRDGQATCGECGLSWDDSLSTSYTPVPSGRCPFEYFHGAGESDASGWAVVKYTGKLPTRGRYIGTWHGGASYSHAEWTDAEWFGTLADAVEAIRDRYASHTFPASFRYVVRADTSDATPCAHDDWTGGVTLYRVTDAVTADDVQDMIGTGYPDRLVEFGPRGGIRVNRT